MFVNFCEVQTRRQMNSIIVNNFDSPPPILNVGQIVETKFDQEEVDGPPRKRAKCKKAGL